MGSGGGGCVLALGPDPVTVANVEATEGNKDSSGSSRGEIAFTVGR